MHRLAIVIFTISCAGTPPPASPPTAIVTRPITPRAQLPDRITPLLPQHGIYAGGSGKVSPAWRVVIDTDAKTIFGGTAAKRHTPSYGPMAKQTTTPLTPANQELLGKLADDAWNEPGPATPASPSGGDGEIFIIVDGDSAFYLQGDGPIDRPAAAKAIIELRAAAGL